MANGRKDLPQAPDPNGEIKVYRLNAFVIVELIDERGENHKMVLEPYTARQIAQSLIIHATNIEQRN